MRTLQEVMLQKPTNTQNLPPADMQAYQKETSREDSPVLKNQAAKAVLVIQAVPVIQAVKAEVPINPLNKNKKEKATL